MIKNIKIIGLGGVGCSLVDNLFRFINFTSKESFIITLIDGDNYELKNLERQTFNESGNKATVKKSELLDKFKNFENYMINDVDSYITKKNINKYIVENDIVFICVDNHKSRFIINEYAKTLKNIILISGGNEYYDGNVQIYIRKNGEDLTPDLVKYHPEINLKADKLPTEIGCEEALESSPQLLFTNMSVALIMCWTFFNLLENDFNNLKYSEIYFDIKEMKITPKTRKGF